jgi:general secretion pathway protein G
MTMIVKLVMMVSEKKCATQELDKIKAGSRRIPIDTSRQG